MVKIRGERRDGVKSRRLGGVGLVAMGSYSMAGLGTPPPLRTRKYINMYEFALRVEKEEEQFP